MERHKAITTAAAASLTVLAGAAGIALNSGIIGASGDGNVGKISPVSPVTPLTATNPPITVYVDDPTLNAATPAPLLRATDDQAVTTSAASGYQDDHYDDDHYEDDDHDDRDRHEQDSGDHDEYEGADDDD